MRLPGGVYFAGQSSVWGGGTAFYDPALPGRIAGRAYLITAQQFADVAAQEMHREPDGVELDLTTALTAGRDVLGPGRYETLIYSGDRLGHPLLTFTAPWRSADVVHTPPAPAYLATLATGLNEAYGWNSDDVSAYLATMAAR